MRILIVARGYLDTKKMVGGFELEQACALKEYGCDVRIIAHDMQSVRHKRKYGLIHKQICGIDCYIMSLPCRLLRGKVAEMLKNSVMLKLYKCVTRDGWIPDIIHAHFGYYANGLCKVARCAPAKLVITEHYSGMNTIAPAAGLLASSRAAYELADVRLAVSSCLANNLYATTGLHFDVVPNLLDPNIFNERFVDRIKKRRDHSIIKIISAGNFYEIKQFPLLIEVLSKIKDYSCFHLSIFGDGPEKRRIQDSIDSFKLNKQVTIKGWVEKNELVQEMLESDIFVLFSRSETFGLSYVEAMACGLPVVSLHCGGTDDTINKTNGIIICSNDPTIIAEELLQIITNIDLYDREMISRDTLMKYNSGTVAGMIMEKYRC